jgi:hypothetical protein
MITAEAFEPDRNNKHKCIYYRNSKGKILRKALLGDSGSIVKDYLYERSDGGLIISIALFGKDHISLLGERSYQYFDGTARCKMTKDWIYEDGQKILTRKAVHSYDDKERTSIVKIFGRDDKFLGYQKYGCVGDDECMCLLGCFDRDDNKISCLDLEVEKLF